MVLRRKPQSTTTTTKNISPSKKQRPLRSTTRLLWLASFAFFAGLVVCTQAFYVWKRLFYYNDEDAWEWYYYWSEDGGDNESMAAADDDYDPGVAAAVLRDQELAWKLHVQELNDKVHQLQDAVLKQEAHHYEHERLLDQQVQEHASAVQELRNMQQMRNELPLANHNRVKGVGMKAKKVVQMKKKKKKKGM